MGSGADSPCQGEMARRARGGRVGDYEHGVLIGAVPGGVLVNFFRTSLRSPAQLFRREGEEQGSGRSFPRQAETETSGLCDDEPPWAKELAARRRRNSPAISLTPKLRWQNNPPAFSQKRVSTFLRARDFKMLGGSKFRLRQGFAWGKTLVRRVRAAPSAMGPRPKRRTAWWFTGADAFYSQIAVAK